MTIVIGVIDVLCIMSWLPVNDHVPGSHQA